MSDYSGVYGGGCGCCMFLGNAGSIGENMCKWCCILCWCPFLAVGLLRNKTREKYDIEGN